MMTKTYKHKMLGHTAIDREDGFYRVEDVLNNFISSIPKRTVEGSSDREEVVEKDWIHKVLLAMFDHTEQSVGLNPSEVRQAIEKHAPKPVKFTMKEVMEYENNGYVKYSICNFLSKHNLLSSDEQGNIDM